MPVAPARREDVLASHSPAAPSDAVVETAAVLRALGDPTRLAIAAMLAREHDALCACHVEAHFDLSQPTISHHLRVLREAGLVASERRGTWVYFSLDRARVAAVAGLDALLAAVAPAPKRRSKACCP